MMIGIGALVEVALVETRGRGDHHQSDPGGIGRGYWNGGDIGLASSLSGMWRVGRARGSGKRCRWRHGRSRRTTSWAA